MDTLRDTVITGAEILLSDTGPGGVTGLGPNLELHDCTIVLKIGARALTLASPRLFSCTLVARRALSPTRWYNTYLQDCTFRGRFTGNDFGHWPAYFDPGGGLSGADFSAATLDDCQLVGVDLDRVVLPRWPCFTIPRPAERLAEFTSLDWPHQWDVVFESYAQAPAEATTVTGFAPTVCKKFGGTPEELRAVLEKLGGIVL